MVLELELEEVLLVLGVVELEDVDEFESMICRRINNSENYYKKVHTLKVVYVERKTTNAYKTCSNTCRGFWYR